MKFHLLSLLALGASIVNAYDHPAENSVARGCLNLVTKYKFECPEKFQATKGKGKSNRYACYCNSDAFLATFMECSHLAEKGNIDYVVKLLMRTCGPLRPGLTGERVYEIYENTTSFKDVSKLNITSTVFSEPIALPVPKVKLYVRSRASYNYNVYYSEVFGGVMLAFFLAVFSLGTIFNFMKQFTPGFVKKCQSNTLVCMVRKKLANPALFGYSHSTPAQLGPLKYMSIPSRAQSWVVLGYTALFVIFMFIKYDVFKGNILYATRRLTIDRFVSDRGGIIATTQLPLVFLTAGRNNFLLAFTGWSYDTMNVYHRWTSRIMYLGVFIHSVGYTDIYIINGRLKEIWDEGYMRWGIVATVTGALVLFYSLRPFRTNLYEFFLVCHWIFVVFFLIGTYYHIIVMGALMQWVYGTIGVWAFDRAVRIIRVLLSGLAKSDTVALPDDYIKMKVRYSNLWKFKTGQYVFIHYLKPIWGFWESHPFTCYQSPVPGEEKILVIVLKARDGRTKALNNYLKKNNGQAKLPVLIDGPYGQHFPIANNDAMIFISGGIGFSATYSYAYKLKSHSEKKRMVFIWITRTHEHVKMFKDELEFLTKDCAMDVQVYLTAEADPYRSHDLEKKLSDNSEGQEVTDGSSLSSSDSISFTLGRPDFNQIVEQSVAEASGSVGVMVCGPPGMNDTVRKATVDNMDKGSKQVNLYVESFNW